MGVIINYIMIIFFISGKKGIKDNLFRVFNLTFDKIKILKKDNKSLQQDCQNSGKQFLLTFYLGDLTKNKDLKTRQKSGSNFPKGNFLSRI
ncbi:MAG: hypothetical protein CM15mP13_3450 [Pseudomonadota bacterium]|nr:MAG: hypothetical protein CM15mP13_3450 [Pseudomonadota bacterium]